MKKICMTYLFLMTFISLKTVIKYNVNVGFNLSSVFQKHCSYSTQSFHCSLLFVLRIVNVCINLGRWYIIWNVQHWVNTIGLPYVHLCIINIKFSKVLQGLTSLLSLLMGVSWSSQCFRFPWTRFLCTVGRKRVDCTLFFCLLAV